MAYSMNVDYQALINQAKAKGDYTAAAAYEASRNEKIAAMNKSGTNSGGYTQTNNYSAQATNPSTDYSAILKNLMGSNPGNYNTDTVSQVQSAFDARNAKIKADPTLAKYANDDIMTAAQNYLTAAKNYNMTNDSLTNMQNLANKEYDSDYMVQIQDLIDKLTNMDEFSYNPENDPAYQAYATKYGILGDNAMNDTLGSAASLTGGLASSAAVSAAAQAKNAYNSQIADQIPELMQAAYSRYQNGISNDFNLVSALSGLDQNAYSQFADQRDSGMSAAQYLANYGYNATQDQKAYDYQVSRDKIEDAQWLSQFDEAKREALVSEAIDKGQLSVSQGNLALSRARAAKDENPTDTSYYGEMLSEMLNSKDPTKWFNENVAYLNEDEIAFLKKYLQTDDTSGGFFNE